MPSAFSLAQAKFVFGPDRVARDRLNTCPRGRLAPRAIKAGLIGARAVASALGCLVPAHRRLVLRWAHARPTQPRVAGRPGFANAATRVDRAGFSLAGARVPRFGFGHAAHRTAACAAGGGGRVPRPCTARGRCRPFAAGAGTTARRPAAGGGRCRACGSRGRATVATRIATRAASATGRAGRRRGRSLSGRAIARRPASRRHRATTRARPRGLGPGTTPVIVTTTSCGEHRQH